MKSKQKKFLWIGGSSIALFAILIVFAVLYKSGSFDGVNKSALMAVTSTGGNCGKPCAHPMYHLYDNGQFDNHKNLTDSQVEKLKQIISNTDFTAYDLGPNPNCPSDTDGRDQVLLFPKKYGNQRFIPCRLNIPINDEAFNYIDFLIEPQ